MSEIFISYARSTEPLAQKIAEALRALGYEVWRDDDIPAHRAYADVIQERLHAAQAVVVVWSEEAARSEWVRSEAERARADRKLVQLTVDGAELPMPFDQIQCADLTDWAAGDLDTPGWRKVVGSIGDLTTRARPAVSPAPQAAPAPRKLSICVLPFDNMSGDAEQEYFSDGISEDIITDLSKVSALSVVARNTAFSFKGKAVKVTAVARELNVSHVLEGSVRKAGGRVRITAQLIDGAAGDHLWAERYDRDLSDIFASRTRSPRP
jgi:adenylate cyclase